MSGTALISGISGQDGAYLAQLLVSKGMRVVGTTRRPDEHSTRRLRRLGLSGDAVEIVALDLAERGVWQRLLDQVAPDEIYNLAAQSSVRASFEAPGQTMRVNGHAVLDLLEALREANGSARLYHASSSEMFGRARQAPQTVETPFAPVSPYAGAKLMAHVAMGTYRVAYGLFAVSGILFNHESPLRGRDFVTRKITRTLALQSIGHDEVLRLGNLDARRDWGFAGDYVDGMWRMLQQKTPADHVLATGITHSVRGFVETAADQLGMKIGWRGAGPHEVGIDLHTGRIVAAVDTDLFRPIEPEQLVGDPGPAETALGWRRSCSFEDLVAMMVAADLADVTDAASGR